MTISYNWLCEYLPDAIEPAQLSKILTSIGLEVESLAQYEKIKGGLAGVVIGEVLTCEQHPNADKLKLTTINIGKEAPLKVVCGAANVAVEQKVAVATVGATIYPMTGEPMTMKAAKIRGEESQGMICAEDELGLGYSHDGILVLPNHLTPGTPAAAYFKPYSDYIFEIGLTPNRMDAMSHLGVARDVAAYLTHHQKETRVKQPYANGFKADNNDAPIKVTVENTNDCPRYAGVTISGVTVAPSPEWLVNKLTAIGVRSINNIVDVTNYILHETGQPLHAFDLKAVTGNEIIVKNVATGTKFTTLDDKERSLHAEDLMICNANESMCIAGVFGGSKSGVNNETTAIFLESACFHSTTIRKTSMRHGLRTDAATRFEKGIDISNTANVLKRAALLIKEVAGGTISCDLIDVYPNPKPKTTVTIKNHYLKKLSGKNYHADKVKRILTSLGFEIAKEGLDELMVEVPYSKPDISIPADLVEEILRIDGLDNVEIPTMISISPSVEKLGIKENLKEKIAYFLVGKGYTEILTNSITNSKYFDEAHSGNVVKMMNNLSAELDAMRPSMLESGLETIAYNVNRRNTNLQLFEFGKTYLVDGEGFKEEEHFCIFATGNSAEQGWRNKTTPIDFYSMKGLATAVLQWCGLQHICMEESAEIADTVVIYANKQLLGTLQMVGKNKLNQFDLKQPVYMLDLPFANLVKAVQKIKVVYKEVNKFPAVQRDLALVVNKQTRFEQIEKAVQGLKINKLQQMNLFDVFESDKLGADKKSMAVNFTFSDDTKTLTDHEIDAMMNKLIKCFEKEINAEIRK
ncbi:phenylalanine--tRNA ligase subunit beta [Sediminibacterium sp.]|uniref:phenylalanine--tRNA ligase subunit beta n=1 Tax=Sediminibacterium sp. TaxID=1917865 RepID=UPI002735A65F|nr:phenylalanine--tRNA ligase subunit beta [Sediminibacterium sp.]MDP3392343.1 phenylalanine--tRNA ligase subunit beta [Sediminibacterium sp.]MDP3566855.1 phenylalanine--tRNA ligase subunit beta [Sediminibacterium sp.]